MSLDLLTQGIVDDAAEVFQRLADLDEDTRIEAINEIRLALAKHSPMQDEPVDCVLWVNSDKVEGNEYNPNAVAPPEMKLLQESITQDGYTQPIVAWAVEDWGPADGRYEVVDGFHRHKVGKEAKSVRTRVRGRLPISVVNDARTERADRMAATIRHNRARGVHTVDGMAELVLDLARQRKSDAWIAKNLGMEPDEVLRLRQTQGLAEMFADEEFSEAWEIDYFGDGVAEDPRRDEEAEP